MINISTKKAVIIILAVLFCFSVIINGYLAFALVQVSRQAQQVRVNEKVLVFRNMFTEKVLLAEEEVDFDTRLALETAVRALEDEEILNQWNKFTKSETKEDASYQAKKLLRILVQKTSVF